MASLLRRYRAPAFSWRFTAGRRPAAAAEPRYFHRPAYRGFFLQEGPWTRGTFVSLMQNKNQFLAGVFSYTLSGLYVLECNRGHCLSANYEEPSSDLPLWVSNCVVLFCFFLRNTIFAKTTETGMLILRALYLVIVFTPVFVLFIFGRSSSGKFRALWLRVLLATISRAGPAFIKFGQWASTRPDIFQSDICRELAKLQNQAPRHSFEETKKIVEEAFGCPLNDIFEKFSEEPRASGSIAQVHEATLRHVPGVHGKQRVAVKVRHPSACKDVYRDIRIINWLAKWSSGVPALKHLQLDKCALQFAAYMTQQLDLSLEAMNLFRFIYNFRNAKGIIFPEPKYPFVHPAVLVETFEEGRSIADYIDDGPRLKVHSQLAELGAKAILKMLLLDNFVHGDLHPGNVFVNFSGTNANLILLDVGMTAEVCEKNRWTLLELFKGVADRDGAKVAACTLDFSETQSCPDPEGFKRAVEAKFKEFFGDKVTSTAESTGQCMTQLFDEIRKHRVNLDGDVCSVMVTTLVLEGWLRKLDPDFDMLNVLGLLLKMIERMASLEYVILGIAAP